MRFNLQFWNTSPVKHQYSNTVILLLELSEEGPSLEPITRAKDEVLLRLQRIDLQLLPGYLNCNVFGPGAASHYVFISFVAQKNPDLCGAPGWYRNMDDE